MTSLLLIAKKPEYGFPSVELSRINILQWISSLPSWIIVYDNTDSLDSRNLESYFPPGSRGNIVITSRNANLSQLADHGRVWEVRSMEITDSLCLLTRAARLHDTDNEACLPQICEVLQYHPLTLVQAGSLIKNGICTLHGFLTIYDKHRQMIMRNANFNTASQYGLCVDTTVGLLYAELNRRATQDGNEVALQALHLLDVLSSLHHSEIPEEMFRRAAECTDTDMGLDIDGNKPSTPADISCFLTIQSDKSWDKLPLQQASKELVSLSLLMSSTDETSYSMHPLVHAWCAGRRSHKRQIDCLRYVRWLITQSICFDFDIHRSDFARSILPHIQHVHEIIKDSRSQQNVTNKECYYVGLTLKQAKLLKQAEILFALGCHINIEHLGKDNIQTLDSKTRLAMILPALGRLHEAKKLSIEVLETLQRIYGNEHPRAVNSISDLADLEAIFEKLGRHEEAEEFQIEVKEI